MSAPEYRRAQMRVRALRDSFRLALDEARQLPPVERRRAVVSIVADAQARLLKLRAALQPHHARALDAVEDEVWEAEEAAESA